MTYLALQGDVPQQALDKGLLIEEYLLSIKLFNSCNNKPYYIHLTLLKSDIGSSDD